MIEPIQQYLGFVALIISVGGSAYAWLTSRSRHNEEALSELDKRLVAAESRIAKVEGELEHLPTKEGQHRLELAMAELVGDMKQMAEALKGTRSTVDRMETVLMDTK